ncbi:FG-GAP repeat domain-containing protein [Marimonas sp. MJW-29]|uniref:FG-GAP repeat domain-containing protein n=1 Tax=Sulfitobacter sediminis TaxID=3234186 RepID=A0ABV3RJ77_9RHOB
MILRAVLLALALAGPVAAQEITAARFTEPTERYGHGILGDAIEFGALEIDVAGQETVTVRLPADHVFEDVAPRLWDVTGDGMPEVVVIETDMALGGSLAVYGAEGKIAETPHIGRTNRWLAPIGAADLDGDGAIEVAYIDRPHLAKVLRVWRFKDGALEHVADAPGFTNHRIGERDIAGGLRDCGAEPEMVVATADWADVVGLRFDGTRFVIRKLGPHRGRESFAAALGCN